MGAESDAQDAAQDVFLKLVQGLNQFGGRAKFSTWLHRVTVNHCLNALNRKRTSQAGSLADVTEPLSAVTEDPSRAAERVEAAEQLHQQVQRLPLRLRAVLQLREIEELTYEEIAARLNIPKGTVMSRLSRAREKLWEAYGRTGTAENHHEK